MTKKIMPQQELTLLRQGANETISRWKSHKENGCNDPRWSDGANMNLLRNHLFYYKRKIREICAEHSLPFPQEAFLPDLPYTDENYFAKPDSERARRIMGRPNWKCYNHEVPEGDYNDTELTLF